VKRSFRTGFNRPWLTRCLLKGSSSRLRKTLLAGAVAGETGVPFFSISASEFVDREGILRVHLRSIRLSEDVKIPLLARSTPGFSGAQLENLVNEAALRGARFDREAVTMADFLEEKDISMMGRERRSLTVSAGEGTCAAYREAGTRPRSNTWSQQSPYSWPGDVPKRSSRAVRPRLGPTRDPHQVRKPEPSCESKLDSALSSLPAFLSIDVFGKIVPEYQSREGRFCRCS